MYVEDGDGELHVGSGTAEPAEADPANAPGMSDAVDDAERADS